MAYLSSAANLFPFDKKKNQTLASLNTEAKQNLTFWPFAEENKQCSKTTTRIEILSSEHF